jgi:uncharacterized protein YPO0396
MTGPVASQTARDEIRRLQQTLEQIIDTLKAQRHVLRQRGMSLPPGTLGGLRTIQNDLETLKHQLAENDADLERLRALADTTALVNSSLNLDQVLSEVMDTVIGLTGADRAQSGPGNHQRGRVHGQPHGGARGCAQRYTHRDH